MVPEQLVNRLVAARARARAERAADTCPRCRQPGKGLLHTMYPCPADPPPGGFPEPHKDDL